MSELLKKQKFGVEVEFTGITRTMAAEAVAEILGSHAAGPDRTCYRTYTIRDSKRRIWKVMRDSSICPVRKAGRELMDEYRVEFVTPPLNYEDIEALQTIIRKFKELGGVSHSSYQKILCDTYLLHPQDRFLSGRLPICKSHLLFSLLPAPELDM